MYCEKIQAEALGDWYLSHKYAFIGLVPVRDSMNKTGISVCHFLQRIDKCRNVFFALKTREFSPRLMGFGNVFFDSLHIARVSKERIARRTDLIGVDAIRIFLGHTDSYALDGTQNLFKAWVAQVENLRRVPAALQMSR